MTLKFDADEIKQVATEVTGHADDWSSVKEHFTNTESAGEGFDEHLQDFSDFMTDAHGTVHSAIQDHATNLNSAHHAFLTRDDKNAETLKKDEPGDGGGDPSKDKHKKHSVEEQQKEKRAEEQQKEHQTQGGAKHLPQGGAQAGQGLGHGDLGQAKAGQGLGHGDLGQEGGHSSPNLGRYAREGHSTPGVSGSSVDPGHHNGGSSGGPVPHTSGGNPSDPGLNENWGKGLESGSGESGSSSDTMTRG